MIHGSPGQMVCSLAHLTRVSSVGFGRDNWQEIHLNDPNTGVGYDDDGKVVARNTLVEVVRRPRLTGAATATTAASTLGPVGLGGVKNIMAEARVGVEGMGAEEALEAFAKGSAAGWQKEVKQAIVASKSRGRGRGTPPSDYRCPRCDAYGEHWIQECPTQGDPAYDRKRVRPPVGIPMTRLARSEEGGLVLPDGNTGTLVANEDAFAREVLGIGSLVAGQDDANKQITDGTDPCQDPSSVKLKSTAEVLATSGVGGEMGGDVGVAPAATNMLPGFLPFSISMLETGKVPRFAGMTGMVISGTTADGDGGPHSYIVPVSKIDPKDEKLFELMRCPDLPHGPRDFLIEAYDRDQPMGKEEFEEAQVRWAGKMREGKSRSRSRSESLGRGAWSARDEVSQGALSRERGAGPSWDGRDRRPRSRSRSPSRYVARDRPRDNRERRYDDRDRHSRRDRELDRYADRCDRRLDRRDNGRRSGANKDDNVVFTIKNAASGRETDKAGDRHRDRYRSDQRFDEWRRDDQRGDRREDRRNDRREDRRDDRRRERNEPNPPLSSETNKRTTVQEPVGSYENAEDLAKSGKHAPIVWNLEPEVDYGASSDEERGMQTSRGGSRPRARSTSHTRSRRR